MSTGRSRLPDTEKVITVAAPLTTPAIATSSSTLSSTFETTEVGIQHNFPVHDGGEGLGSEESVFLQKPSSCGGWSNGTFI